MPFYGGNFLHHDDKQNKNCNILLQSPLFFLKNFAPKKGKFWFLKKCHHSKSLVLLCSCWKKTLDGFLKPTANNAKST
jgi:hypothetical protein